MPETMKSPKIIFDTDMGPDYDDIGAIAVLHALADSGECDILATVASDAHPTAAPTIDLFNRYYGRTDLLVGQAVAGSPDFTAPNNWNAYLIDLFGKELSDQTYPDAVSVYRKVLAEQADQSVTIVTVGFLSNLHALLKSSSDQHSPLSGVDLVKKKVKKLVSMAGSFPSGTEFNVHQHPEASIGVFEHWPTPILFSGFEIGAHIMTGAKVAARESHDPVSKGYAYNLETFAENGEQHRNSWDQTTVLVAVRDPERYFYVNGPGKFEVREDGSNRWNPESDAQHYFLGHKYPYHVVADLLEDLMLHQPKP